MPKGIAKSITSADILRQVLGPDAKVSVNIPTDATLEQVMPTLSALCGGMAQLDAGRERLKPVIGRILLTIQTRKLYKQKYPHFAQFLEKEILNGGIKLGRSTAFEALRIARAFPSLTTEEYGKYGATRLLEASKFTSESRNQSGWKGVLDKALTAPTIEAFKEEASAEFRPKREVMVNVVFRLSVAQKRKVDEWFSLPATLEWAGSDDRAIALLKMIELCKAELPSLPAGKKYREPRKVAQMQQGGAA